MDNRVAAAAAVVGGLALWAGWIEPRRLVVRDVELAPAAVAALARRRARGCDVRPARRRTARRAVGDPARRRRAQRPRARRAPAARRLPRRQPGAAARPRRRGRRRRARAAARPARNDRGDRQPRLAQLRRPHVARAGRARDHRARGSRRSSSDGRFWVAGTADMRHRIAERRPRAARRPARRAGDHALARPGPVPAHARAGRAHARPATRTAARSRSRSCAAR